MRIGMETRKQDGPADGPGGAVMKGASEGLGRGGAKTGLRGFPRWKRLDAP